MIKDLNALKSKLELLEKTFGAKTEEVEKKSEKWEILGQKVKEIREMNEKNDIITINVGGKKFATTMKTLMNVKDTLFYKIIISKKFDIKKEIFIDRSGNVFKHILEFLRYQKFRVERFTPEELAELKEDAEYYDILPLENILKGISSINDLKYIKLEVSAFYYESSTLVGSTDPSVLLDKNLQTGVCTATNGWMILELNCQKEINQIDIGGFTGKSDWVNTNGYGANALIQTSVDKTNWKNVGYVPTGFGTTILPVVLTKSTAKYIKLSHSSWLGIGYLKISN